MPETPIAPRVMKGGIVSFALPSPVPTVITFQYNPDTLTRTIQPQGSGGEDRSEVLRLKGAPVETIKFDAELDATDALEKGDPIALASGLLPQLSALEILVYPASSLILANSIAMAFGTLEVIPPVAPFTLFVWGAQRILPVRVTDLSITEEAFDTALNPIRAKVSLGLRVLSYNDVPLLHPAYSFFLTHHVLKEQLASIASFNSVAEAIGSDLTLF